MKQFLYNHRSLYYVIGVQIVAVATAVFAVEYLNGVAIAAATATGLMIGGIVLLAAWMALATAPTHWRVLGALAATAALGMAIAIANELSNAGLDRYAVLLFALCLLWLRVLLGVGRLVFGWQIAPPGRQMPATPAQRQFRILHLMLLTGAIACGLAGGNWLMANVELPYYFDPFEFLFISLLTSGMALPSVFIVGAFCDARRRKLWIWISLGLFLAILLITAIMAIVDGGSRTVAEFGEYAFPFAACELVLCGSVLGSLALWRYGQKWPHPAAETPAANSAEAAHKAAAETASETSPTQEAAP